MSGAAYLFDKIDLLLALLLVCHTREGYIADPHSIQHVLQLSPGLLVLRVLSGASQYNVASRLYGQEHEKTFSTTRRRRSV